MMTVARVLLALVLAVALASPAAARGVKYGVFGKIKGKQFRAKSNGRPDDNCVYGTYLAEGGLSFTAGECRGQDHKVPKESFSQVVFVCGVENPPKTPPYDAVCSVAAYVEARVQGSKATGQKAWLSSVSYTPGSEGRSVRESGVRLHVDSFDGTFVKGSFSGVLDVPQVAGRSRVPIDGEVHFFFPVRAVQ
jgi:hypothetical protein